MSAGGVRKPICIWLKEFSNKTDVLSIKFDDKSKRIELELENDGQQGGCTINRNESRQSCTAVIRYCDVVGSHLVKGKFPTDSTCYLRLFVYPFRGGIVENGTCIVVNDGGLESFDNCRTCVRQTAEEHPRRRRRKVYTFKFSSKFAKNSENFGREDDNWTNAKFYLDQINFRCSYASLHPKMNRMLSDTRKLIVFVNPFAGPGKALHIFRQKVLPVFAEAGIQCRLVVTERANQVFESIKKLNIYEWDGIVIVSGDGLVFELLNGLATREDREKALKIPIGVVPGGSGNGLAAACCFESGDSCKFDYAMDAAVLITKPNYSEMKLVHVQTRNQHMVSFMSTGWGLLADIDIESEKFRRLLGSARFIAGGLVRWANLRVYKGRISFKLAPHRKRGDQHQDGAPDSIPPTINEKENGISRRGDNVDLLSAAFPDADSDLLDRLASHFPSLTNNQFTGKSRSADEALLEVMAQDVANLSNYYRCSKSCNELAVNINNGDTFGDLENETDEDEDEEEEGVNEVDDAHHHYFMNNGVVGLNKLYHPVARFTGANFKIFTHLLSNLEMNPSFFDNDRIIREKCMIDNGSILCKLDETFSDSLYKKPDHSALAPVEKDCPFGYLDSVQMPKLSEPVPSDWTVIEDDFVMVYVISLSHIASDMPYMPRSAFDDDVMYLTLIRASRCNRLDLLRFLSTIDTGKHLETRCVEVYPITAFRLERLSELGVVTVDGEDIKCDGPVQACLSKLKATVMTSRKVTPVSKL